MIASTDLIRATVSRIRRNHALEHATVHILGRVSRDVTIYARSGPRGLVVFGNLPTQVVADAASEALARLRNGEAHLAVHPHCGTSLVTSGTLSGLAALLAMAVQQRGKNRNLRQWLNSLPLAVLASTAALLVAQPVGLAMQLNVTTDARMGDLFITDIARHTQGRLVYHSVRTSD